MEADGLFVYGTLRAGGSERDRLEQTRPQGTCRAWVPGRLFHLPATGRPVLVADREPTPRVTGEFVGYEDEAELEAALDLLDSLEPGRLVRRVLPVLLDSGSRYGAWVHVLDESALPWLEREGVELPSGDWAPYLDPLPD